MGGGAGEESRGSTGGGAGPRQKPVTDYRPLPSGIDQWWQPWRLSGRNRDEKAPPFSGSLSLNKVFHRLADFSDLELTFLVEIGIMELGVVK